MNRQKVIVATIISILCIAGLNMNFSSSGVVSFPIEGWNLVSFTVDVNKTDVYVLYNDSIYTWTNAVNDSLILGFAYGWDQMNQNYEYVDAFEVGRGYWTYSFVDNLSLVAEIDILFCGKIYFNGTDNLTVSKLVISPQYNNTIVCNSIVVDEVQFIYHNVGLLED